MQIDGTVGEGAAAIRLQDEMAETVTIKGFRRPALEEFSEKWDKHYPYISPSWKSNWDEIVTFFKYPPEIRTLVYTTNPIESLNRKIKKVAKNKSIFPNDQALIKQVYLAVEEAAKKWTFRHRDWAMIYSQLMIYFGDRLGERA
jgi:putative transposase